MTTDTSSNRGIWLLTAALVFVLVGGYAGWRLYSGHEATGPAFAAALQPPPPDAGPATVDLAEGDAVLKAAAAELSAEALLARWLAEPDLVRRLVAATFQVSRGESPRELLVFLQPPGLFTVDEVEEPGAPATKSKARPRGKGKHAPKKVVHAYMTAASTARYDAVARVLSSIDAARLGRLYAKLSPFAELAFREAAPPGKRLEDVFGAAVEHLAQVPLSDAPLEVVPMEKAVGYTFLDPRLEALSPAQKHLLRMGPANARAVVKALQSFRAAAFSPAADAGLAAP